MNFEHYIYQRIHTLAGKPLHLAEHLNLAARAYRHIYGGGMQVFDERAIVERIAGVLRANNSPVRGSATVMLLFAPAGEDVGRSVGARPGSAQKENGNGGCGGYGYGHGHGHQDDQYHRNYRNHDHVGMRNCGCGQSGGSGNGNGGKNGSHGLAADSGLATDPHLADSLYLAAGSDVAKASGLAICPGSATESAGSTGFRSATDPHLADSLYLAAGSDIAKASGLAICPGSATESAGSTGFRSATAPRLADSLYLAAGSRSTTESALAIKIEYERPLLDVGYAVSSLRPRAVCYEYSIPFGGFPTGFQLSAAALFDTLALEYGATRSIRREGDKLISCGGAPVFGIKGKTLFTASLLEGAVESVERRSVIAAAAKARLDFLEEAVPHSELTGFDELFYADAAGITSFSECDGAKFMSLTVSRIVDNL